MILAVDQGTTGTKSVVFDAKGRMVAQAYREFPQVYPKPGWVAHDAEAIWQSVELTVRQAVSKVPGGAKKLQAIGITNQRETVVAWSRATAEPLAKAIVWQCRRTSDRCEALRRKGWAAKIRRKTGLPIDPYFSATKMAWLLENERRVEKAAAKGDLCLGTVDSFLLFRLTGREVFGTDRSNASRTMLYSLGQGDWDKDLLRLFSVPGTALPALLPSSGVVGRTKGLKFLPDGIPIAGVAGDQQAALFGQFCHRPGMAKNTYGTGAFCLMNTGAERVASRQGLVTSVAWEREGRVTYCLEGSIFICGAVIQWLRDGLGLLKAAAESERLASQVNDSMGVVFVPAFVGLGAPYWDPSARGAILGLTRGVSRAHIVRAALESMVFQVEDVLEAMRRESRLPMRVLRVDGGAAANNLLCQMQADVSRAVVERGRQESTAWGAALLAGVGVGFYRDLPALARAAKPTRFTPSRRSPLLNKRALWRQAVERARHWAP